MNPIPDVYIFESPDNGNTVYRRKFGHNERELISISDDKLREKELNTLWLKWISILRASRKDPALKELIERAETYYHLKSQP